MSVAILPASAISAFALDETNNAVLTTLVVNDDITVEGTLSDTNGNESAPVELTAELTENAASFKIKATFDADTVKYSTTSAADAKSNGTELTTSVESSDINTVADGGDTDVYIYVKDSSNENYYKLTVTNPSADKAVLTALVVDDDITVSGDLSQTNGTDSAPIELTASLKANAANFKIKATFTAEEVKYSTTSAQDAKTGTALTSDQQSADISTAGDTTDVYIYVKDGSAENYYKLTVTNPSGSGSGSSSTMPGGSTTKPVPNTPTVTPPSTENGATTVGVNTNSTTTGTTASASVSSSNMDSAINSAIAAANKQNTSPVVEVNVKTSSSADTLNVSLPTTSLKTLAKAENSSLVVTSNIAEVALDNTALSALADQATGSTVVLKVSPVETDTLNQSQQEAVGDAPVVDLSLISGNIVIHDYDNGKITATLPYKLPADQLASDVVVYYLDDAGKLTACDTSYDEKTSKVSFVTTHLSMYVIGDPSLGAADHNPSEKFVDVDQNAWYREGVDYVVDNGLMEGIGGPDTTIFAPNTTMTRAMIVTVLYRLEGKPAVSNNNAFSDVASGHWFSDAINWAAATGVVTGYGDTGLFGPGDPVTREEMATIFYRYATLNGYDTSTLADLSNYPDADAVSSWAYTAMRWAVGADVIEGVRGSGPMTLSPQGDSTRAMVATILMRFCNNVVK